MNTTDEVERLRWHWGFIAARELGDGSIAGVHRLTTTWSLVLGVHDDSWRYRFCYRHAGDALAALDAVQGEEDIPEGWIACRPQVHVPDERGVPRYPTPAELRALRLQARTGRTT